MLLGEGRFEASDAVQVAGQTLRFARACIATGARASAPPIPGLDEAGYLGSEVTLLELMPRILGNEDADAAAIVQRALVADGIRVLCGSKDMHGSRSAAGKRLSLQVDGVVHDIEVDEILVGVGRVPNVTGLGLESPRLAGVLTNPFREGGL